MTDLIPISQDPSASMFLSEKSYNLTCLPSGEWSGDLLPCIQIFCQPVTFNKKFVNQVVMRDSPEDLARYKADFELSCAFKYEVFDFGENIQSVDYFCNRR